jgi:hypothetical protein
MTAICNSLVLCSEQVSGHDHVAVERGQHVRHIGQRVHRSCKSTYTMISKSSLVFVRSMVVYRACALANAALLRARPLAT